MARKSRKAKPSPAPARSDTGWWDRLPDRTQHLICLIVLLVVAFTFYAPVVFSGQSLIGEDTVRWRAMAEFVVEHKQETGERALWAPNAFAGMPGYMISYPALVPQIDDLPALVRPFLWPVSHLLVLLLGTYLLLVFLIGNKLAGVLSAVVYGLTTYLPVILVAGHNSKFIALSFVPWLVLAFAYMLRRPTLLASLLFAIALGANIQAGHAQITYYAGFLLGIWWIVELVGSIRRREVRPFAAATVWLILGSVLGLLLVAQPYLANFEYKRFTIRGGLEYAAGGGLDWAYAMSWSQGIGELITLIAADAYGGASPTYWGPKPFTSGPHYVGAIAVLLAVAGAWSVRGLRASRDRFRANAVMAFGISGFLMVLFSLGEHLPSLNRLMFAYFPLFDAFRVPETWLSVVAFVVAVLAGVGMHHGLKGRAPIATVGALGGLFLVLLLSGGAFFSFERPGEAAQVAAQLAQREGLSPDDPAVRGTVRQVMAGWSEERAEKFRGEMVRALLFLALAGALLWGYRTARIPRWAVHASLVLLVVVDLWGVGRRYFGADDLVEARAVQERIPTYDFDRFLLEKREEATGLGHFRVLSLETGNPFTNARPSFHHESVGGYHGAKLRLIQDYIDHLFIDPQTGMPNENALDMLNTRYVVAAGRLPGMQVVYQGEETGLFVLENRDALPRAVFVGHVEVIEDREEAFARVRSTDFDPRARAILSAPIDFEPTPIDTTSIADVLLERYAPDEIVWNVETDAPRLLVVSEVYYPAGWRAYVGEEEVPIYRVNHLLRAVPVPEGTHRVEMRFEPASHRAGLWISWIATLLVYGLAAALLGRAWIRRRRAAPSEIAS